MAPPIDVSFLFKAYLYQYFRIVLTVIFKFQITKEVNMHDNIQIIILKFSKKTLIFFVISKFFYNNNTKTISRKLIISS